MAKEKQQKSMESILWDSCNKLRGSVEPAEYKHVILSLIFLKYANDRFELQREKLISDGKEQFLEMVPFYTKDNIFFVPEVSRWAYLKTPPKEKAKDEEIESLAIKIDTALHEIELKNPSLKGALPDNYFSRLQLEESSLKSLLDILSDIDLKREPDKDIFGRIYEYFLLHFAMQEGKGKGEYYTPKSVVALLCELIEPYSGKVYDGACGSGGMFIQSMKFIEQHQGNRKEISVYGQESIATTMKLAKMNLAIRGISANFGKKATSTFTNDQHKDLKADYILMNPPFNLKEWREENTLIDDPRWKGYDVPPVSNANYAWILNMVSKLSNDGTGCLLLANGALSIDGTEYEIRKQLIENDLVEAILVLPRDMFYSTNISVTIWILNKNKHERTVNKNGKTFIFRARENEILFMDLRQEGHPFEKKYIELTEEDRKKITDTFHSWQTKDGFSNYKNIKEFCFSARKEDIINNNYSLVTSKYIEFNHNTKNINYDEEMKKIQKDLCELFSEEEKSKNELSIVLKELGYGIRI